VGLTRAAIHHVRGEGAAVAAEVEIVAQDELVPPPLHAIAISWRQMLEASAGGCISDLVQMLRRLAEENLPSRIIWSVDENTDSGLVDVLPESASKLHAVRFLMEHSGHRLANTLFAGDSGNDLEVLCSDVHSVLVANASDSVREQALRLARQAGTLQALYAARGGLRGMNGNYSAGILEGLVHFMPDTDAWIA
jgi:hypothetical protein